MPPSPLFKLASGFSDHIIPLYHKRKRSLTLVSLQEQKSSSSAAACKPRAISKLYAIAKCQRKHTLATDLMTTASFVTYLHKPREPPVLEFRAPPPSPVTGVLTSSRSGSPGYGERPDGNEDDDVGRFLRRSARVPVLRLPERAAAIPLKKKKAAWAPPVIDMRLLTSPDASGSVVEALRSAAVAFGCFQVVGHGVNGYFALAALRAATTGRVRLPASEETDASGRMGDEDGEEMWWSLGEGVEDTAGNWPLQNGANQFRNRADDLYTQLEQTATKILDVLQRGNVADIESLAGAGSNGSSRLCIRTHQHKQRHGSSTSGPISHDDILRMLIQSSRRSRALALHLCPGASAFHIFSRRGWSRFHPLDGAIVVTVGDQLQAWSSGIYRSVAGKPAYINDDLQGGGGDDYVISAEFLHCRSSAGTSNKPVPLSGGVTNIIPFNLQITVAACLVLVYHSLLSCWYAIW